MSFDLFVAIDSSILSQIGYQLQPHKVELLSQFGPKFADVKHNKSETTCLVDTICNSGSRHFAKAEHP